MYKAIISIECNILWLHMIVNVLTALHTKCTSFNAFTR